MLAFCESRKNGINAVIAYKVDRISRNIADYSHIKVRLKRRDIQIKSVTEYFEDTPAGRFMENIIANVSQFDNEVRTERSVGGMKEAVQEGRYVWKAPIGYENIRIDKATIAPSHAAPLVLEAFEMIAERLYSTEVVRLLMAEKGLADRIGNPINHAYFYRLLRNPLYKGVIEKFGMTVQGTFEAILPVDLFETVQGILKGKKNKTRHYLKENPDFPLRRFIKHETGKLLVGYWSKGKTKRYPYYSFGLPNTTIRKEALEQKFLDLLQTLAFDTAHINLLREALEKHFGLQENNSALAAVAIKKRIEEINTQIDKFLNLIGSTTIKEDTLTLRIKHLEAELDELKTQLYVGKANEVSIAELMRDAVEILKAPHVFWQSGTLEIRKLFQEFVFTKGVLWDGNILRTPKIASVFKVKEVFDDGKSSRVDSGLPEKNTLSTDTFTLLYDDLLENRGFWEAVRGDLIRVRQITKKQA